MNTKLPAHQQEALRSLTRRYQVIFNSVPGIVWEPTTDWLKIPIDPALEAQVRQKAPYPLSEKGRKIVDAKFDENRRYGRMTDSPPSPFGLPVFVAAKDRPVIDMRPLNALVPGDAYPLPRQEDVTKSLRGKAFMSSIDITSAFYQRMIHPDHQYRTGIVTHRGHEMFRVSTMSYKCSPAHQQRLMDRLRRDHGMSEFMAAYIDDIMVYSDDFEAHLDHLERVFRSLANIGVTLKASKCHFGYQSLVVLGHMVDRFGLSTTDQKADAVANLPVPSTLADLEHFIGLTNWHRHLIAYYAQRIDPLQKLKTRLNREIASEIHKRRTAALQNPEDPPPSRATGPKPKIPRQPVTRQQRDIAAQRKQVQFSDLELKAFRDIQQTLASKVCIRHFDPSKKVFIFLDASRLYGFGAAAYQEADDLDLPPQDTPDQPLSSELQKFGGMPVKTRYPLYPIAFASRELSPAEKNYWPTDMEMAGLVFTVKKMKHYLETAEVEIFTDHQANAAIAKMMHLYTTSPAKANLRLQSWAVYLSQYWPLTVTWLPGSDMECPDTLSRVKAEVRDTRQHLAESADSETPPQTGFLAAVEACISITMEPNEMRLFLEGYPKDRHLSAIVDRLAGQDQSPDGRRRIPQILFELSKEGLLFFRTTQGRLKLAVPRTLVKDFLERAHDAEAHGGAARTLARLSTDYYWKNMRTDILEYIRFCPSCLTRADKNHPPFGQLHPIPSPPCPFHTISIDLATDLPPSTKFNHGTALFDCVMVVTDKFTRMIRLISGRKDYKATAWARLLFENAIWGLPQVIISDRDGRFTAKFWRAILALFKAKAHFTTAYNPQSDGQSERSVRTVICALRHFVGEHQQDWPDALPFVEHALNSAVNATTEHTPYELLMGFNPTHAADLTASLVLDLKNPIRQLVRATSIPDAEALAMTREAFRADAVESTQIAHASMKEAYDAKHQKPDFSSGYAYIKMSKRTQIGYPSKAKSAKLAPQRVGPFPILEEMAHGLAFRLDLQGQLKIHPVISVTHLEPAPTGKDPFERLPPPEPERVPIGRDRDGEFQILDIVGRRTGGTNRRPHVEYLVRWKQAHPHDDIWLKEDKITGAEALIDRFHLRQEADRAAGAQDPPSSRD